MGVNVVATEKSSIKLVMSFTGFDNNPITPDSISWTLTNADGVVVNGRVTQIIAVPSDTIEVLLSGDDLMLFPTEESKALVDRFFIVEAMCTSGGGTYPVKNTLRFKVENLIFIA